MHRSLPLMWLRRVNAHAQSRFAAAVTPGVELAYHKCEGNVDRAVGDCGGPLRRPGPSASSH
jgi:hypothetical protein